MKQIVILLLALSVLVAGNAVNELKVDNFVGAKIILNTIHDGYHSYFKGPFWNYRNQFLIFQSCEEETTPSVQRQFVDIAVAKFRNNVYAIPIFVFESEVTISETPETRDILMPLVRKYGDGLGVTISIVREENDKQLSWVDGFLTISEHIDEIPHQLGKKGWEEITQITTFLGDANLCQKIKAP